MPVIQHHDNVEKHFSYGQVGYWDMTNTSGTRGWHWTSTDNNVWITPKAARDGGGYEVSHRHTGRAFPRLFPLAWAPDYVWCLTRESAIKYAAQMVLAYKKSRIMGPKVWCLISEEARANKRRRG